MALTALGIKKAGDGRHGDGNGLELYKKGDGGKWIYRYSINGKRRQMGLGTWPTVSLAEARKERDRWALLRAQGKDPIAERDKEKAALKEAQARRDPTLEELAQNAFESYKPTLRRDGEAARWMSPLEKHVFPRIGRKPVSTIEPEDIRAALAPIWTTKHPTAEKAIQRLRMIFRTGRLRGLECDPFKVDVALDLLGPVNHKTTPTPATDWRDIPKLYQWLEGKGTSASCLQFLILTVVRTHGCRAARFDEIHGDVWTVPAERMKGREKTVRDFRVPLSPEAMEIIERRRPLGGEFIFPGYRGTPLTDSSMSKFLRDNGIQGKPHGFRTSFRTWVQDTNACSWEVAETVLAHTIGDKTERAYARSDLLDRRRPVMEAWARHVTGKD